MPSMAYCPNSFRVLGGVVSETPGQPLSSNWHTSDQLEQSSILKSAAVRCVSRKSPAGSGCDCTVDDVV